MLWQPVNRLSTPAGPALAGRLDRIEKAFEGFDSKLDRVAAAVDLLSSTRVPA